MLLILFSLLGMGRMGGIFPFYRRVHYHLFFTTPLWGIYWPPRYGEAAINGPWRHSLCLSGWAKFCTGHAWPMTCSRDLLPGCKKYRERLLHVNIFGCGLFAAVSGSSAATAATIGKMTHPGARRPRLSGKNGHRHPAGSATLGFLIPPSLILIVYGVSTEQSISRLFICRCSPWADAHQPVCRLRHDLVTDSRKQIPPRANRWVFVTRSISQGESYRFLY